MGVTGTALSGWPPPYQRHDMKRTKTVSLSSSEKDFMSSVIEVAELGKWLIYHTYDSRRSQPGFPDLVLCKDGRVIFAELKSQKGPIRKAQQEWLDNLQMNNSVEVYLWRPADIDGIHGLLLDKKTVIT